MIGAVLKLIIFTNMVNRIKSWDRAGHIRGLHGPTI